MCFAYVYLDKKKIDSIRFPSEACNKNKHSENWSENCWISGVSGGGGIRGGKYPPPPGASQGGSENYPICPHLCPLSWLCSGKHPPPPPHKVEEEEGGPQRVFWESSKLPQCAKPGKLNAMVSGLQKASEGALRGGRLHAAFPALRTLPGGQQVQGSGTSRWGAHLQVGGTTSLPGRQLCPMPLGFKYHRITLLKKEHAPLLILDGREGGKEGPTFTNNHSCIVSELGRQIVKLPPSCFAL